MRYDHHDICVYVGMPSENNGEIAQMLLKISGKGKHKADALVGIYIRLNLIIRRILNILSRYIEADVLRRAMKDAFVNIDEKTKKNYGEEYAEMEKDIT